MEHRDFMPRINSLIGTPEGRNYRQRPGTVSANREGDVGFNVQEFQQQSVANWSLIFPLKGFKNPAHNAHIQNVEFNQLFGVIIHNTMLEPIVQLSRTKNSERTGYAMTIESI